MFCLAVLLFHMLLIFLKISFIFRNNIIKHKITFQYSDINYKFRMGESEENFYFSGDHICEKGDSLVTF